MTTEVDSGLGSASRGRDEVRRANVPAVIGKVPAEAGVWVLLAADVAMFAVLFAFYLYARGSHPSEFMEAQKTLNRAYGAVNTLVLLSSSLLVVYAGRVRRTAGNGMISSRLMMAGCGIGLLFVVIKSVEYFQMFSAGITANTGEFYMYYFALTGLHLSHVVIGLGILLVLAVAIRRPQVTQNSPLTIFFEAGSLFWHAVDGLWLLIYPLVFLVR